MTRRLYALVLISVLFIPAGPALAQQNDYVRYDNWKILQIDVETPAQLEQLRDHGARLLSDYAQIGLVEFYAPPEIMPALEELGVEFKVLNDNLQKSIDAERARLAARGPVDPRGRDWYDDYKSFADIYAKLQAMVADHPEICTLESIGTTLHGRDIWLLRVTGPGSDKPAVLFNGTQHAREWISPMVNMHIAEHLVYNYDTDPQVQSLVNNVEFMIIPVVNADGYVYSWTNNRMWRKTRRDNGNGCYGVDPNRNWDAGWGGSGASGNPCDDTYYGPSPFSEPCTAAMRDFYDANPQIVANIDYHSYSQLILSPYGYTSDLPADHDTFMDVGTVMEDLILGVHGEYYEMGPIYSTIYPASGGSVDWCYDAHAVFSYTIELRPETSWQGGFELPPEQIIPTCEENLPAAMFLAEWASSPVVITFPNGQPTQLQPLESETVMLNVMDVGATHDPAGVQLHTRIGGSGDFTAHPTTPLGNNDYEATLPATPCGATLHYYFSVETLDGQNVCAPADAPTTTFVITPAPLTVVLDENLSSDPGWSTEGLWEWGQPTGGGGQYGGPDPVSGYTGSNVYGYNLTGDYENSLPERHLTTPMLDCTGVFGAKLSFWRWLGVERSAYDHAYLRINDGGGWSNLWQNSEEVDDGAWVYLEYDIAAYADDNPNVQIRWTMGTTDYAWQYCGWNIDDVMISAVDPAGCAVAPADMNCDGNVNFDDIDPFVLALVSEADYYAAHLDCNWLNADINGDGFVNFDDIDGFVDALVGS